MSVCAYCHTPLVLKIYPDGRSETKKSLSVRKYCNLTCTGKGKARSVIPVVGAGADRVVGADLARRAW